MTGWGTAISAGLSFLQSMQDRKLSKQSMAMQQQHFNDMKELSQANQAFGNMVWQAQQADNAYQREIEQLNRLIAQDERAWQMKEYEGQKAQLLQDRNASIERQILEDKDAARLAAFQMQRLLMNQELTEAERAFALKEYEEAKAIAEGERDEDKRLFLQNQAIKEIEKEFMMNEFLQAKSKMKDEADIALAYRDNLIDRIEGASMALDKAAYDLGPVPELRQFTEQDIRNEQARRESKYMSDVDRAAEAVASVNEADLIRGGIDRSSTATDTRGEIARRIADEYQTARMRAGDDALRYITDTSNLLASNVQNNLSRRGSILDEVARIKGAGIQDLMNLQDMPSVASAIYNMAGSVPSSLYDRSIQSASASAPINIGSGVYEGGSTLPTMATYRANPLSYPGNWGSIQSAAYDPSKGVYPNASSFYSQAGSTLSGLTTPLGQFNKDMMANYRTSSKGFGTDMSSLWSDFASSDYAPAMFKGEDSFNKWLGGKLNKILGG